MHERLLEKLIDHLLSVPDTDDDMQGKPDMMSVDADPKGGALKVMELKKLGDDSDIDGKPEPDDDDMPMGHGSDTSMVDDILNKKKAY